MLIKYLYFFRMETTTWRRIETIVQSSCSVVVELLDLCKVHLSAKNKEEADKMPIDKKELGEAFSVLTKDNNIRATIKGSLKTTIIVAGSTLAGALVRVFYATK